MPFHGELLQEWANGQIKVLCPKLTRGCAQGHRFVYTVDLRFVFTGPLILGSGLLYTLFSPSFLQ